MFYSAVSWSTLIKHAVSLQSHTSSAHGFYDDSAEEVKKSRMRGILGDAKAHYPSLIEQLLFMEETHCR